MLFSLSFFSCLLSFQFSNLFFFLSSFSWNKAFHALHVITNSIFIVILLALLFRVFGHCKTSWQREMFYYLACVQILHLWWYVCNSFHLQNWNNLYHINIKCLMVCCSCFLICICSFYIITWTLPPLLMVFHTIHQSVSWEMAMLPTLPLLSWALL